MKLPLASATAVSLRQRTPRRWLRRILVSVAGLTALLTVAVILVAYVWQPREERGYRSHYLAQVTSRYVDTPIARFHYTKTGNGPPVVLLPGGTLWIYSYRQVIPQLARHFTVVAVDLPGQGYTTLNRHDFSYDLQAMSGALGSFMDAVGLPRASLVGHSWDGAVSLYFAERHPERVNRLILIDSPGLESPARRASGPRDPLTSALDLGPAGTPPRGRRLRCARRGRRSIGGRRTARESGALPVIPDAGSRWPS